MGCFVLGDLEAWRSHYYDAFFVLDLLPVDVEDWDLAVAHLTAYNS